MRCIAAARREACWYGGAAAAVVRRRHGGRRGAARRRHPAAAAMARHGTASHASPARCSFAASMLPEGYGRRHRRYRLAGIFEQSLAAGERRCQAAAAAGGGVAQVAGAWQAAKEGRWCYRQQAGRWRGRWYRRMAYDSIVRRQYVICQRRERQAAV